MRRNGLFGLITLGALCAFCGLLLARKAPSQTPAPPAHTTCFPARPVPIDHWRGEYFNNRDLGGASAMIRDEGAQELDFDWGLNSPAEGCVNVDNFSARWTRTVTLAAGAYRFTVTADDGVRLLVDGQERLNEWREQPLTTHTVDVALAAGNHKITLEYFERLGSAIAKLAWAAHPCVANVPADHWRGEYFNSSDLSGQPATVRDDGEREINFAWQEGSSLAACGLRPDNFSVRWTQRATFGSGVYRFEVAAEGGARVLVDGQPRFDEGRAAKPVNGYFDLQLAGGLHQIVYEYRRGTGQANAALRWKPLPCVDNVPEDHWRGEYFNNESLTGQPVMVRDDGARELDFNWADASPGETCNLPRDNFSVRWTRNAAFTAGLHRFVIAGNDGLRFYIDGQLKLDQWREQSASYIVDAELGAGNHQLRLEFNDLGGKASVKLAWEPPPCRSAVPVDHWRGEYFNNKNLQGSPLVVRDEGTGRLDFDWQLSAPHADCFVPVDTFSARWTRTVALAAGVYRFRLSGDDGVRLLVDGKKLIDEWRDQPPSEYTADIELTGGEHRLVLEFYENYGSAQVRLDWAITPCLANVAIERWRGEYFNSAAPGGRPQLVRDDGDGFLDFAWGAQSPAADCGVNADNFAARWTRTVAFAAGIYRFMVGGDDGFRLFIDGQLKLDRWQAAPASYTFDVPLTAGNHQLVLEYREGSGDALVKLAWSPHPCQAIVQADHWRGEYFDNSNLSGRPRAVRDDGVGFLSFDWGTQSPQANCYVGPDDFSVRWTRNLTLDEGRYRFTITGDDGVRLLVDDQRLIDEWRAQEPQTYNIEVFLPAGSHRLALEYFKRTGAATARLSWQQIK